MRWFRGWGGREGTCPVSGVVRVGGFVSFDSSNGAQARVWAKLSTKDSSRPDREAQKTTHTKQTLHSRKVPPQIDLYLVFLKKERKKEKRSEEKSRKEKTQKKNHIFSLEARIAEVHRVSKFCVARKRALVVHRKKTLWWREKEREREMAKQRNKARQKDSNLCEPKQWQQICVSRSLIIAKC